MSTTYLILLILLIVYIPFYIYVRMSPAMKERGIVPYGPFVMFKTKRGIQYLDKAAKYKRFWNAFGTVSKILALFLMLMIMFIIIVDILLLPRMMDTSGIGVEYALALPGINPMLPLIPGVIGLVIAVAIHEIAHGIQTRANDMTVESTGLLYAVVPIGAFVEPNDEQLKKCSRKPRSDVFAAGIAINVIVAIVIFFVMTFGMMSAISPAYENDAGVTNVYAGSPADDSGIVFSSLILKIDDGSTVTEVTYDKLMEYPFTVSPLGIPAKKYTVTYLTPDGPKYTEMYMGVFMYGIAKGSPADKEEIPRNSFLVSIGGAEITTIDSFRDAMGSFSPGDDVTVEYKTYKNGVLTDGSKNVTLGNNNGTAFLGVNYSLSGFAFTKSDDVLAKAKNPFHGVNSLMDVPSAALSYIGKPFGGYDPIPSELQWWYSSSVLSDNTFWTVLQVTFWIFWLNLVLAVTNALPAVPFDGGYLFRDGVGAIVDRTHKNADSEKKEKITNTVTTVVSYIMLGALLLIMMAIIL